jgi:hypothetical protein
VRKRDERCFDAGHGDAAMTADHHRRAIVTAVQDDFLSTRS